MASDYHSPTPDTFPAAQPIAQPALWRARLAGLTVADGLMALIVAAAALLRLGDLGGPLLSPGEATAALANWQFWSAVPLTMPVASPAYFAFTHLVMALGGSGDTAARLAPAVFGLLTVALPWLWRGRARPVAWLVAGLFLAVSPLLVAVSRTAGGDAIALFAVLLLAVAGLNRRAAEDTAARRWAIVAGAALGLGLTSSPLFYSGLVALLIAALAARRKRNVAQAVELADVAQAVVLASGAEERNQDRLRHNPDVAQAVELASATEERNQDRLRRNPDVAQAVELASATEERNQDRLRYAAVAAAVTFLLVATSALLYPAGVGAALRLLPAWLGQFGLPAVEAGRVEAFFSPLLALLRYEPAIFALGLPAALLIWRAERRRGLFLVVWLGLAAVIALLQAAVLSNAAAMTLPAYLLVGGGAAALRPDAARRDGRRMSWGVALAVIGLGALVLAAVARFTRLNLFTGEDARLIVLALLAFVLAALAVLVAMAWDSPAARRGAFIGVAALLLFWQWGAAWQLSRVGVNDPRERWVTTGVDDDARALIDLLTSASLQMANSDRDLIIFSQVDSPVLRWYLRAFPGFAAGPALPVDSQADVVITPAATEPALPNDYFGADFGLLQREIPGAGPATLTDRLRWWLFRESSAPLEVERVVVWVRSDLLQGE